MMTDTSPGLSEQEARERLAAEGYNELPSSDRSGFLRAAGEVLREPMFLLLLACGGIYVLLGDRPGGADPARFRRARRGDHPLPGAEDRARARGAARPVQSSRPRDPRRESGGASPGREVVRGDVLVLSEGRSRAGGCGVALLPQPLRRRVAAHRRVGAGAQGGLGRGESHRPPGGRGPRRSSSPARWSRAGMAWRIVQATGARTEMGRIGKALHTVAAERSPLQRETGRAGAPPRRRRRSASARWSSLPTASRARTGWAASSPGSRSRWRSCPNEFPAVLTIFLALGAWRISQQRVLTRRVPALETLGSATVLCVDKTGTLTQNQMAVRKLVRARSLRSTSRGPRHAAARGVSRARRVRDPREPARPVRSDGEGLQGALDGVGSPAPSTCIPTGRWCASTRSPTELWRSRTSGDRPMARESRDRGEGRAGGRSRTCATCARREQARSWSRSGEPWRRRDCACSAWRAHAFRPGALPSEQHDFAFEFVGLAGLADPVRTTVPAAIENARRRGSAS